MACFQAAVWDFQSEKWVCGFHVFLSKLMISFVVDRGIIVVAVVNLLIKHAGKN